MQPTGRPTAHRGRYELLCQQGRVQVLTERTLSFLPPVRCLSMSMTSSLYLRPVTHFSLAKVSMSYTPASIKASTWQDSAPHLMECAVQLVQVQKAGKLPAERVRAKYCPAWQRKG